MKSKKRAAIALGTAIGVCCGAMFSACRGGDSYDEQVDESKAQLYVMNYDGGFGTDWLRDVKNRFEAQNADKEYLQGKKGVQILIDATKTQGTGLNLPSSAGEVFFTEIVPYFDFASSGQLLDVSDVVTEVLAQDGVSMSDSQKNALTALDGKYYALPHYEGFGGVIYNKSVFRDYALYFDDEGDFTDDETQFSAGPDGEKGTSDDGLPATYKQFLQLCEQIGLTKEVTSFVLSGQYKDSYVLYFLDAIATAYNGNEISKASYTFGGKIKYVTQVEENPNAAFGYGLQLAEEYLTEAKGYLTKQTAGKFYALALLKDLISTGCFDSDSLADTVSHLDAQETFLTSELKNKPIAMLIDGSWWENEAKDAFARAVNLYGEENASKYNRDFGWMPLPCKADDTDGNEGNPYAVLNYINAYGFIKSNIDPNKIALAKDFLKFCYTAESLEKFTEITGTARFLNYPIADSVLNKMSPYGKEIWKIHQGGNVISTLSESKLLINKESDFTTGKWITSAGGGYSSPFTCFRTNSALTVKQYYEGMLITEAQWRDKYGAYIGN